MGCFVGMLKVIVLVVLCVCRLAVHCLLIRSHNDSYQIGSFEKVGTQVHSCVICILFSIDVDTLA